MAMEQAIQMLEGNEPAEKHIVLQDAQFKSTNPELGEKIGVELIEYKDGENVFKDYSAGFSWAGSSGGLPGSDKGRGSR